MPVATFVVSPLSSSMSCGDEVCALDEPTITRSERAAMVRVGFKRRFIFQSFSLENKIRRVTPSCTEAATIATSRKAIKRKRYRESLCSTIYRTHDIHLPVYLRMTNSPGLTVRDLPSGPLTSISEPLTLDTCA